MIRDNELEIHPPGDRVHPALALWIGLGLLLIVWWISYGAAISINEPVKVTSDIRAYLEAAQRLAASGSPYLPYELDGLKTLGAYLYLPTLAQLLVPPVAALGFYASGAIWLLTGAVTVIVSPFLGWRSIAPLRSLSRRQGLLLISLLGWAGLAGGAAIWTGNLSAFLPGLLAAAMISGPGLLSGLLLAAMAILKLNLLPFALVALLGRRTLAGAVLAGIALVGALAVLAPDAWLAAPQVLLDLNAQSAVISGNLSMSNWLAAVAPGASGLQELAHWLTIAAAAALTLWALRTRAQGLWLAPLAAAALAAPLLGPQIWVHYLAMWIPVQAAALAVSRRRAWFIASVLVGPVGWFVVPLFWVGFVLLVWACLPALTEFERHRQMAEMPGPEIRRADEAAAAD